MSTRLRYAFTVDYGYVAVYGRSRCRLILRSYVVPTVYPIRSAPLHTRLDYGCDFAHTLYLAVTLPVVDLLRGYGCLPRLDVTYVDYALVTTLRLVAARLVPLLHGYVTFAVAGYVVVPFSRLDVARCCLRCVLRSAFTFAFVCTVVDSRFGCCYGDFIARFLIRLWFAFTCPVIALVPQLGLLHCAGLRLPSPFYLHPTRFCAVGLLRSYCDLLHTTYSALGYATLRWLTCWILLRLVLIAPLPPVVGSLYVTLRYVDYVYVTFWFCYRFDLLRTTHGFTVFAIYVCSCVYVTFTVTFYAYVCCPVYVDLRYVGANTGCYRLRCPVTDCVVTDFGLPVCYRAVVALLPHDCWLICCYVTLR